MSRDPRPTYKFVPNPDPVLDLLGGDDDTVDEGEQGCLVGRVVRPPQLVQQQTESVATFFRFLENNQNQKSKH